ncbi:MAG: phosphotransferase family protein [Gammaproteobacteria bacterium]|nr:phosphotransferase family protein [Gammaproteobacteria bacterium]MBI5616464.1 phosphotransferase family protein [Gammaproteobacteria bacterium]
MVKSELKANLQTFIDDHLGHGVELHSVHDSDGHAGLTFLFDVQKKGTHEIVGEYVLKVPPPGVARRGNTDVYRQAPLLRALHAAGLPVPDVPFASENEHWFGVPFIVMERLPGRVFFIWDPHKSFGRSREAAEPLWRQCAELLPRLHQFDWRTQLAGWDTPEPLADQVKRWSKIYRHSPEPAWITLAEDVERLLLAKIPTDAPEGLYHGDFQPGNCLYHEGRLTGVIDWEISGLGAQLLDVGWLMMCADPENWVEQWHAIHPLPLAEIRDIYERGMGRTFASIPWFQAFAGYRLGSIGCLNVKLHRKGQRIDEVWEHMSHVIGPMFERSRAILTG